MLVCRRMDVATDNPLTILPGSKLLELVLMFLKLNQIYQVNLKLWKMLFLIHTWVALQLKQELLWVIQP